MVRHIERTPSRSCELQLLPQLCIVCVYCSYILGSDGGSCRTRREWPWACKSVVVAVVVEGWASVGRIKRNSSRSGESQRPPVLTMCVLVVLRGGTPLTVFL